MREGRLKWFGHVRRRSQQAPIRRVEALTVDGTRKMSRPKLRWDDRLKLEMKELLLSEDMTSYRNAWRDKIRIYGRSQQAPVRRVKALIVDDMRRMIRPKLRWNYRLKLEMKEFLLSEDMTSYRNAWRDKIRIYGHFKRLLGVIGITCSLLLCLRLQERLKMELSRNTVEIEGHKSKMLSIRKQTKRLSAQKDRSKVSFPELYLKPCYMDERGTNI
ncbi:hypothetical protein Tco_0988733 [Tanacetum coccineum]|uniref:Uncharacterized protein n=1 Tax=Tanacetum coccineum TaxID=301880 RepID=A0ABQ5ES51_9ASTR